MSEKQVSRKKLFNCFSVFRQTQFADYQPSTFKSLKQLLSRFVFFRVVLSVFSPNNPLFLMGKDKILHLVFFKK